MRTTSKMVEMFAIAIAMASLMCSVTVTAATSAASITFAQQQQLLQQQQQHQHQPHAAALVSSPSVAISSSTSFSAAASTSSASSSITKPDYGITNVTAQIGTNAYLPCKVSEPFPHQLHFSNVVTVFSIKFLFKMCGCRRLGLNGFNYIKSYF